jgi:hypothetical protein
MKPAELQEILRLHRMWLRGEDGGARADISGADLREADFSWASLSRANLSEADLSGANLSEANLSEADLSGADLSGADISRANLSWANLSGADITRASLSEVNLSRAIDGSMCRMDFGGWSICIRAYHTSIGCQRHPNEKWLAWSPDDVAHMHTDARDWWVVHGEAIKAAIKCVMAKAAKAKEAA